MPSTLQIETSPVQVNAVGQSWTQENRSLYGTFQIPQVLVAGYETGYNGTTNYKLGKLNNFMRGLRKFRPGMARSTDRALEGGDVAITVDFFETPYLTRSSLRPSENRFQDLRGNLVPGLQGQAYIEIDRTLVDYLQQTAVWGAAKTFTNGPIQGNSAAMTPIEEINDGLIEFAQYNQFDLVSIMDETTAMVLRQATAYRSGADSQLMLPEQQFINNFKSYHNLDKVIILKSAKNKSRPGQTADIVTTGRGLLWFGCVDKRPSFTISAQDQSPDNKPDGALAFGYSRLPTPDNWIEKSEFTEYFRTTTSFGFFNPRLASDGVVLGFFYDPASILTSP